jgi:hypothetical protein
MTTQSGAGLRVTTPTCAVRGSEKYLKIFSVDSKKCVIIEGFADRGEDVKTEGSLMATERWWLRCLK